MTDQRIPSALTDQSGSDEPIWYKTACVLCSCNCGVEVRLDDRRITRVKGNKAHLASKGYTCEKALRIDHYQNGRDRLTTPLRRRPDGTYEEVDWDTAIAEVAAGLRRVGGDATLYYGGGGQGNHLVGAYGAATRRAFGISRRSNALAQEKTGEAWVDGRMFGTHTTPDFHHSEVAVFLGKNPWHSHGIPEARRTIKAIAADEDRALVVIDPRRTETADLADHHLQVVPGTDAFCLAALLALLVERSHVDRRWLEANAVGTEPVLAALGAVPIDDYAERCGIDRTELETVADRIGRASSVAILEDLGVEMAPNSTLVSWLQKLVWALTGHFAKPGGMNTHSSMAPLFSYSAAGAEPTDPVTGSPIISGLLVCNEIAEAALAEGHPDRIRAMFIESANPVHSLADSQQFRQAMRSLEFSVVIDVAMTETAREADYVLPACSQYEKAEATFFNLEFPENVFHLRPPLLEPLGDSLPEAEIHARLVRAAGVYTDDDLEPLRAAAAECSSGNYQPFGEALMTAGAERPELAGVASVILYETLGPILPDGLAPAAVLWFSAQQAAMRYGDAVRAAGIQGDDQTLGDNLFEAILAGEDGVTFTRHDYEQAWSLLKTGDGKIQLDLPEMVAALQSLSERPTTYASDDYPFVLSAGERRSFTANTIIRDPQWRKRDAGGSLRMHPADADELGVDTGSRVRVVTKRGAAEATVETTDTLLRRHITLPNGLGLDYPTDLADDAAEDADDGAGPMEIKITGVAPNELTASDWKDEIAGTPWHKHVPARVEPIPA